MLFVKTKETEKENTTSFEVLTRSPFKGYTFDLPTQEFKGYFAYVNDPSLNTDSSEFAREDNEENVYICVDKKFYSKMLWWELNVNSMMRLYHKVYSSDIDHTLADCISLDTLRNEYADKFNVEIHKVSAEMTHFDSFFNTAREVECSTA